MKATLSVLHSGKIIKENIIEDFLTASLLIQNFLVISIILHNKQKYGG